MKRKTIGKRLRFAVFHRDMFTCQYCGRTPENDDVILHVDHIISVKDGGTDEKENLTTSCRDCNLGKSATSVVRENKNLTQELSDTKERLEQLKQLCVSRKKIQETKREITRIERDEIEQIVSLRLSENLITKIIKVKLETEPSIFNEALEITDNKFSNSHYINDASFIKYLKGVIRNLSLSEEERNLIKFYHSEVFSFSPILPKTREFILKYKDFDLDFHKDVYKSVLKSIERNLGNSFKLRDEVAEHFNQTHFTIHKSGIGYQLCVCDCIVMELQSYE